MYSHRFAAISLAALTILQDVASAPLTEPAFDAVDQKLQNAAIITADDGLQSHCANNFKWTFPAFDVHDCNSAIQEVYHDRVWQKSPDPKKFVTGTTGARFPVEHTPMKWTRGTCTVAIVMLETVLKQYFESELPGLSPSRPWRWPREDGDSYPHLLQGLRAVRDSCNDNKSAGWIQMGDNKAIGVFVWATGSTMDSSFRAVNIGETSNGTFVSGVGMPQIVDGATETS